MKREIKKWCFQHTLQSGLFSPYLGDSSTASLLGLAPAATPPGSVEAKVNARERQGPEQPGFREGMGNTALPLVKNGVFPVSDLEVNPSDDGVPLPSFAQGLHIQP